MPTTTNYGWTTPADTDLVKDGASAIRTLGSAVDTTVKNLNPETTLGDISYRSSTSNTNTRLAIGTSGQVLTVSGGVPAWANAAGGGSLIFISRTTFSGATSQNFDGVFTSTYKAYLVIIEKIGAVTQTNDLEMNFRYSNTTDTSATHYAESIQSDYATTAVDNYNTNGLTYFKLNQYIEDTVGYIWFFNIGSGSSAPSYTGQLHSIYGTQCSFIAGSNNTLRAYDGFSLSAATNIDGTVAIYGVKTS